MAKGGSARWVRSGKASRFLGLALLAWALLLGPVRLPVAGMGAAQAAESRLALVIGNGRYSDVPGLQNSVADARAMRAQLQSVGFEVVYREDADRRSMNRAVDEFVDRLSADSVGLIYYAGHGVQIGANNYLLPTDIRAETANDVASDGIDLTRVLERVSSSRARFLLAIIDACRDNPFRSSGRGLLGGATRGLAPSTSADGVMVVYSAGANQTALDRLSDSDADPNGVFTREWLKAMRTPGQSVQAVATTVRQSVAALARSVNHLQTPAVYDQSLGTFEFVPATAGQPAPPVAVPVPPPASVPTPASVSAPPAARMPVPTPSAASPPNPGDPALRTDCDRLAQPAWSGRRDSPPAAGEGVSSTLLDGRAAYAACTRAMADWPAEPRFAAYAARAADKNGDARVAARLYRQAADQGNAVAQNALAAMYSRGEGGLPRDDREAVRLYHLAADQGYAVALTNLGAAYYAGGSGVPRSDREAVQYFRQAAEQGYPQAQTYLGMMYHQGRGVAKDEHEAARLYRLAAEHDDGQAQNNLASLYMEGRGGLPRDRQEAIRLLRLSAANGYDLARENLRKLGIAR